MKAHLSAGTVQLATTEGLGIGGHWQLQHIEENVGDVLRAAEREVTPRLLLC